MLSSSLYLNDSLALMGSYASPSGYDAILKRYNGAAWVKAKLQRYDGSDFVDTTLKYYDGSWKTVDTTGV